MHHLLLAADAVKPSKVPFYVAGGCLAAWAVLVALFGISRHRDWPAGNGAARGVMLVTVVLVAAAMATAVITS